MSEPTDWYAPNQQAVRGDESGPAEEGEGGTEPFIVEPVEPGEEPEAEDLGSMTKAELLEVASARGIEVDETWTKAEIREEIEGAA
jgi:hypothetical protein